MDDANDGGAPGECADVVPVVRGIVGLFHGRANMSVDLAKVATSAYIENGANDARARKEERDAARAAAAIEANRQREAEHQLQRQKFQAEQQLQRQKSQTEQRLQQQKMLLAETSNKPSAFQVQRALFAQAFPDAESLVQPPSPPAARPRPDDGNDSLDEPMSDEFDDSDYADGSDDDDESVPLRRSTRVRSNGKFTARQICLYHEIRPNARSQDTVHRMPCTNVRRFGWQIAKAYRKHYGEPDTNARGRNVYTRAQLQVPSIKAVIDACVRRARQ